MILEVNPISAASSTPPKASPATRKEGLLALAGQRVPFVERNRLHAREGEHPLLNKFLQGYYDSAGIALGQFRSGGAPEPRGRGDADARDGRARHTTAHLGGDSTFYLAFNFKDALVGGSSERAKKLRQALSIAIDWEEFISIFANGRGIAGMGPFRQASSATETTRQGYNPVVYDWVDGKPQRKAAQRGEEAARGSRLSGTAATPGADSRWCSISTPSGAVPTTRRACRGTRGSSPRSTFSSRFARTDWNRFRRKSAAAIRRCSSRLNADYPDPENFMFLLYGPNGNQDGETSPATRARFRPAVRRDEEHGERTARPGDHRPDGENRARGRTLDLGLPSEGLHALAFLGQVGQTQQDGAQHAQVRASRPALRERKRAEWNRPVGWPLVAIMLA